MKLLLLFVAFVALAYSQVDSDNCRLDTEWSQYQTEPEFVDALWEDQELIAWGMDGDNKWNDFWRFRDTYSTGSLSGLSHYEIVTCQDIINTPTKAIASIPGYVMTCGDCTITQGAGNCNCYPYYDVAGSYQESVSPYGQEEGSTSSPTAPAGWSGSYVSGNPPYEQFPISDGSNAWTLENCKQYEPYYIYYYTYRLKISSSGDFYKSFGISRAFTPAKSQWDDFCEMTYPATVASPFTRQCYVPSYTRGSSSDDEKALIGAEYQYQEGQWRDDENTVPARVQFYHNHFEAGCHFKSREHRFPTASYCGDASGWTFGAGTTAHVRFGCDTGTFQDTTTDGFDIDDGDCSSAYLQFDQYNRLTTTVDIYGPYENGDNQAPNVQFGSKFAGLITFVNTPYAEYLGDSGSPVSACWYRSNYIDHRTDLPSYRTPCSAGVLAVPVLALLSTLFVFLRNLF